MMSEGKLQTVGTTGKPDWCPAMVLAEVWDDGDDPLDPEERIKYCVAWDGQKFINQLGARWDHASPIYAPEPKPRSFVWWWVGSMGDDKLCEVAMYERIRDQLTRVPFIPARYENDELEPAPTVAEARRRKEAGL